MGPAFRLLDLAAHGTKEGAATHELLSGLTGSVSLAAWIFLLIPQIIENYQQGSADGISTAFLLVWFLGDITNLAGALWARLVPTVIAIGIYYCFSDSIILAQSLYYKIRNHRREVRRRRRRRSSTAVASDGSVAAAAADGVVDGASDDTAGANNDDVDDDDDLTETEPLLSRIRSENIGLPGSHTRRRSSAASKGTASGGLGPPIGGVAGVLEREPGGAWRETVKNTVAVLAVCAAGIAGWVVAWKTGVWEPAPEEAGDGAGEIGGASMAVGAAALGYISAVCYLGARIPQIIKNQRERSCEGLSLLFFMLSLLGNATYGASILTHSLERDYVIANVPWLIGSLGTMAEDGIIFAQFHAFKDGNRAGPESSAVAP